jgi:hypothetical protein
MTLTALTRFISKRRKGEIFQIERGGDGHTTIYFHCTDPTTGKVRHFAVSCEKAEQIRVYPESFSKLTIHADTTPPRTDSRPTGKRRKKVLFDEMYITGYGFQSVYVPVA